MTCYNLFVIKTFRHRGLKTLFETGSASKVQPELHRRCLRRLDVIDNATSLAEIDLPGFKLHQLKGQRAGSHAISVNGPWRITFEWVDGNAYRVDLEQYH